MRIIAGRFYGQASPVTTFSPLFYADATLQAGASSPSKTSTKNERFISLEGKAVIQEQVFEPGRLLVFLPAMKSRSRQPRALACCFSAANRWTAYVTFGGICFESRASEIEQAKSDWKAGRFARGSWRC